MIANSVDARHGHGEGQKRDGNSGPPVTRNEFSGERTGHSARQGESLDHLQIWHWRAETRVERDGRPEIAEPENAQHADYDTKSLHFASYRDHRMQAALAETRIES